MSPIVIGLLLASALIHAVWNAIVRNGDDRFWSLAIICLVGAIAAVPFATGLGLPAMPSWPYLILSSVLQIGYCLFLVRAYRDGELSSVYPIARGSAPLLVTLGAALVAGEWPNGAGLVGILCVSFGIILLTLGSNRPDAKSAAAALGAGVFIASYMVVDGLGVRLSESATFTSLCASAGSTQSGIPRTSRDCSFLCLSSSSGGGFPACHAVKRAHWSLAQAYWARWDIAARSGP